MYGIETDRGGATVVFAGLAVAMLTGERLARIRDELREILPDYHDAEEIPTIEGHFERKYGETQAELAAVRCELGELRSRYERELDESPRKRARV
jgi:hypothetical protein